MVGPAGKEQVNLAEKSEHRRNSPQREQAEAQAQGDQWILLVEAGIVCDAIGARAQREENDAGKGAKIHKQIGGHVQHHGRKAILGAANHANHHKAGLAD